MSEAAGASSDPRTRPEPRHLQPALPLLHLNHSTINDLNLGSFYSFFLPGGSYSAVQNLMLAVNAVITASKSVGTFAGSSVATESDI